jgi:hypothetical protein
MNFIPNAGKVVTRSLAVGAAVAAQAIPFALQAASEHIAAVPDMSVSTRSILQALLTVVLVPLGRAVVQNLAARFPPADAA